MKPKSTLSVIFITLLSLMMIACNPEPVAHEHSWDKGVITTPPSCIETGLKTYTCTGCKETKTETIENISHKYIETEEGLRCSICEALKVDIEAAEARIGKNYYSSLEDAIKAATETDEIILLKDYNYSNIEDLSLDKALTINKACTINGNGLSITYNGTAIPGEDSRLLNITDIDNGTVILKNLTVKSTIAPKYFRGINIYDNNNLNLKLENTTVSIPDYYAINIVKTNIELTISIENSKINGWSTIYNRASDVNLTAINSIFDSKNIHETGGEDNSFSSIIVAEYFDIDNSGIYFSDNNTFIFENCTFSAIKPEVTDVTQVVFDLRSPFNNTLELNNCIFTEVAEPHYIRTAFDTTFCTDMEKRHEMLNSNVVKIDGHNVTKTAEFIENYLDTYTASETDNSNYQYPYNPIPLLYDENEETTEIIKEIDSKNYKITSMKISNNPEVWTLAYDEVTTV